MRMRQLHLNALTNRSVIIQIKEIVYLSTNSPNIQRNQKPSL